MAMPPATTSSALWPTCCANAYAVSIDSLGRYGGEFLVVLPDCTAEQTRECSMKFASASPS